MTNAADDPARIHQPGEASFRVIHPEAVLWKSFPAFPPEAPHKHPEDRIYTVISGVFYIGLGEGNLTCLLLQPGQQTGCPLRRSETWRLTFRCHDSAAAAYQ